jgi:hypothetical protein
MTTFYLPGCKFTKLDPQASKALIRFCKEQLDAIILGCCSKEFATPKANDTVIYVCPTCALIMQESSPSVKLKSIYEVVLEYDCLPPLSWVDLKKEKITVQDCWRSRNHPNLQASVREILKKMNASIVELENNFEHSDYCGSSLLQEPSPRYKTFAPNLFKDPIFKPCSFEEQEKILSKHAEQYSTVFVGCYCTGCFEGIQRMNSRFSSNQTETHIPATQANSKKLKPVHIASLVAQSLVSS